MKNQKNDLLLGTGDFDKLVVNGVKEKNIKKSLEALIEHADSVKTCVFSYINGIYKLYVVTGWGEIMAEIKDLIMENTVLKTLNKKLIIENKKLRADFTEIISKYKELKKNVEEILLSDDSLKF